MFGIPHFFFDVEIGTYRSGFFLIWCLLDAVLCFVSG